MNVLIVSNKMPYPPKDGGSIATYNLASGLKNLGCKVTVLAMNTSKHYIHSESIPDEVLSNLNLHFIPVNNTVSKKRILKSIFTRLPYHVLTYFNTSFEKKLLSLISSNSFDIIQMEGLYLTSYVSSIRKVSNAKICLRAHNIEHLIWQRKAEVEKNSLKKTYFSFLAKQLKKYEITAVQLYDAIIPISTEDEKFFKLHSNDTPCYTCPASYNEKIENYKNTSALPGIFFLGALDWQPNMEGLKWFVNTVWPIIHAKNPNLKLNIAGRNCPPDFFSENRQNIIVHGEVENAYEFMNKQSIMIVPLFSGSGMRIKIIEGMALEKCIISTSLGFEGIEALNNEHLLKADTKDEFVAALEKCINNPEFVNKTGIQARLFVKERYSTKATSKNLLSFYCSKFGIV